MHGCQLGEATTRIDPEQVPLLPPSAQQALTIADKSVRGSSLIVFLIGIEY